MIGKSKYGWAKITVGSKYIGTASAYLNWLPTLVLEPCVRYLSCAKMDKEHFGYAEGEYGFNLEFDAEGWTFGIVEIGSDFFIFNNRYMHDDNETPVYLRQVDLEPYNHNSVRFVLELAKEAVNDIEDNFEEWVILALDLENNTTEIRKELRQLLINVKSLLNEFGKEYLDEENKN